ncbi:FimV/HubP family polar landmark protein [Billgrantia gudaonensis]|uniref:Tetratricopeptide repeat-containing protein n=1 Tax=Billgrantia gudaonensis TaxID=376427 RepID=A0A1G8T9E9_9GAMM|nr:FimV/HubP family polar landmark protein [Halomonas gudaonensis]SDJ38118.1 Tetratricopeptide repeat-containing protein [Halomonas gudaonensis]
MSRKLTFASLLSLSFVSPASWALGVGDVDVHSSLNAPLRASVPLTDVAGLDLRRLKVSLAEPAAFERAGLERMPLASDVTMAVRERNGQWVVELESDRPVREPWLDLLLRFDWPEGRQLREVTLLLDPPNYAELPVLAGSSGRSPGEAAVSTGSESSASPGASTSTERGDTWVGSGDTLWSIADRLRPDDAISMDQMMVALVEANPEVFPSGNINSMRAGHSLSVPSRDAILSRTAEQADRVVAAMNQAWAERDGGTAQRVALTPAPQDAGGTPEDAADPMETAGTEPEPTLSDAAIEAAESVPVPRLTLLSDRELAAEGQARGEVEGESQGAPVAGHGGIDPGVVAELATPELALLDDAGRQAVRQRENRQELESQRDALQAELEAMRDELDVLRGQLASVMAERAAESDPAGTSPAAEEGADSAPWWGAVHSLEPNRPLWLGAAGIAALLGLWLVIRWRRGRDEAVSAGGFVTMPTVSPAGASPEMAEEPAPTAGAGLAEEPPARPTMPQAEAINEADIFMAYGRYDQARELLEAGIARAPERSDLRFKLLTACVEQGDWTKAQREAQWLRDHAEPSLIAEVERLMARPPSEVEAHAATDEGAPPSASDDDAERDAPDASREVSDDTRSGAGDWPDLSPAMEAVPDDAEPATRSEPEAKPESEPDSQPASSSEPAEEPLAESAPRAGGREESVAETPTLAEPAGNVIDYQPPALDSPAATPEETPMQPSVDFTPRDGTTDDPGAAESGRSPALGDESPSPVAAAASGEDWEVEEVAFPPLDDDNGRPFSAALADDSLDEARRLIDAGESERARALLQRLLVESGDDELCDAARGLLDRHRL